MSENVTVQMAQSKTTNQFEVYDAPDEGDHADAIVGTYIAKEAAEQLGEFVEITVAESSRLPLTLDKETASYGVFSDANDAIEATYISHEVLAEVTGQDADSDSYETPDSIEVAANPSDESAFEEAADNTEARAEAASQLIGNSASSEDTDDSDESQADAAEALVGEADDDSDEEVEISDEEVGLAE